MQSETKELARALSLAQGQMRHAILNKTNPHFRSKYADLASIIDAVRKPLTDNSLSWVQTITVQGERVFLITRLLHPSGECISSVHPLPSGVTPQAFGSALTYAKRYSLSSLLCISADDDDDANLAEKGNGKAAAADEPVISQEQVAALRALLARTKSDEDKFCSVMRAATLKDIKGTDYQFALAKLNAKLSAMVEADQALAPKGKV
jgi:ERF superfamily